jgi:hypothetical protein
VSVPKFFAGSGFGSEENPSGSGQPGFGISLKKNLLNKMHNFSTKAQNSLKSFILQNP